MAPWSGYLSSESLHNLADVLVEEGLESRSSIKGLLGGVPKSFFATFKETSGLNIGMRLRADLRWVNSISALEGGLIPMQVLLSGAAADVQDQARKQVIKQAQIEFENNSPATRFKNNSSRQINSVPLSHFRFNAFADRNKSATAINSTNARVPEIQRELNIGRDEKLSINFAEVAMRTASSVFKIMIHRHFDNTPNTLDGSKPDISTGTAWVLGPGIGITNYHVFEARLPSETKTTQGDFDLQVTTATLVADYFDENRPQEGPVLGSNAFITANPQLDYAIFKLPEPLDDRQPLQPVRIPIRQSNEAPRRSRVNVIQHPGGLPMKLAIRNNYILAGSDEELTYLSDTESGSSGSPVLNDNWQVAALHIGGRENDQLNFTLLDKPIKHENIGVAIHAVLADIKQTTPDTYQTIVGADT